jgi:hypothetical protein
MQYLGLVGSNAEYIEGKVDGKTIVIIITQYVKKHVFQ